MKTSQSVERSPFLGSAMLVSLAAISLCLSTVPAVGQTPSRPNIVFILADDLGFKDVGFNGQSLIKTPNIDRLASQGLRFNNGYCPAAVCAPTRAALLQGFHNGHTFIDRNEDTNTTGLRSEDVVMPEVLRDAGYSTGAFGKWGFGEIDRVNSTQIDFPESVPTNQGVQDFYGFIGHGQCNNYFPSTIWNGGQAGMTLVNNGGAYHPDVISAKCEQYIAARASDANPFFMYAALSLPHWPWTTVQNVPNWDADYRDPQYSGWDNTQKGFAAMVTRMDATVGRIMSRLEDPNQDGNTADSIATKTLIVFASDNGPNTNQGLNLINLFDSNGIYRGSKRDLYDGGLRVPMVARWTGTIQPGASDRAMDMTDWMPTFAQLAGTAAPVGTDGVSLAPTLTGVGAQRNRDYLYYEMNDTIPSTQTGGDPPRWAVRRGDYKLIKFSGTTGFQLFNTAADPSETTPLNLTTFATVKTELESIALAEGGGQAGDYAVTYRQWTAASGSFSADANWSGTGLPSATWSASIVNSTTVAQVVTTDTPAASVLGLEVRSTTSARQTLDVQAGHVVTGRNEIRIGAGGTINLRSDVGRIGVLESVRWIDVLSGGSLTGEGQVRGVIADVVASLYNSGTVAPGQPTAGNAADLLGILDVKGDFAQTSAGLLELQMRGRNNSDSLNPMFDQLLATGTASIGGRLKLQLIDGFVPRIGDTFELLKAGALVGTFSQIDGLTIDGSRWFEVSYTPTSVMVTAVPEPGMWFAGCAGLMVAIGYRRFRAG